MLKPAKTLNQIETKEKHMSLLVYFLYILIGLTGIIGPLIGFLLALSFRKKMTTDFGRSHSIKQIRLAKICLSGIAAGLVITIITFTIMFQMDLDRSYDFLVIPGFAVIIIFIFWFLFGVGKGLSRANNGYHA